MLLETTVAIAILGSSIYAPAHEPVLEHWNGSVQLEQAREQAAQEAAERAERERVVKIQSRLDALGYPVGSVDGDYGPMTEGAVREFQRANGLSVDGVVGSNTSSVLFSDNAKRMPKPEPAPDHTHDSAPAPEPKPQSDPPPQPAADWVGLKNRYCPGGVSLLLDDPRLEGYSGRADPWGNAILVDSGISDSYAVYVIAHECAHITDYRIHGGFSPNLEAVADCATVFWGIGNQNYTTSCSGAVADAARRIVNN